MERIVALNRGPFVAAPPPLGVTEASEGLVVIDVRGADAFAAGHVPGALNIPLSSSAFGTKAGFVLHPDDRVAIHADSAVDAELAARRLYAVGFLALAGRLEDPPATERVEPVDFDELEQLVQDESALVLDVREKSERDDGYIPGSMHVPYRLLRDMAGEVSDGKPVVTICSTGSRATIAASVLAAQGVEARPVLQGGVTDWAEEGRETVHFRRCGS